MPPWFCKQSFRYLDEFENPCKLNVATLTSLENVIDDAKVSAARTVRTNALQSAIDAAVCSGRLFLLFEVDPIHLDLGAEKNPR